MEVVWDLDTEAMQTAAGSLCTTHAYNARGAIERLVGLAMEAPHITSDVAYDIGLEYAEQRLGLPASKRRATPRRP